MSESKAYPYHVKLDVLPRTVAATDKPGRRFQAHLKLRDPRHRLVSPSALFRQHCFSRQGHTLFSTRAVGNPSRAVAQCVRGTFTFPQGLSPDSSTALF